MARIEQLNTLLQQHINEIFVRDVEWPANSLATIIKVSVSPDLSWADIAISVLPINRGKAVLKKLNNQTRHIQHLLKQSVRLRKIPKLRWHLDDTELKNRRIERELAQ
ncbi:MAG: ribosome-binding factor A [Candidatus Komeilibacteria bacterium]